MPPVASTAASADGAPPLVTIGIPAYNRPASLRRAVRSALAQTHSHVEVLISDDASSDAAVAATARALVADDERVSFIRQDRNLGHDQNYQWVLEHGRGEFFMWLSDDDWIDPAYVARCLRVLRDDPSVRLAWGTARYDDGDTADERPIDLMSRRPGWRVLRYFARVSVNGALFGLARRGDLLEIGFPSQIGGDWLLVAAHAGRGRVRCVPGVHVHRSDAGLGSDAVRLAASFGHDGLLGRHHHMLVAARIARSLLVGETVPTLAPAGRSVVALGAAGLIAVRFTGAGRAQRFLGPRWDEALAPRISAILRRADVDADPRDRA